MRFIFALFIFLLTCSLAAGQIFHNDPYKLVLGFYNLTDLNQDDIRRNRVKSLLIKDYYVKSGWKLKRTRTDNFGKIRARFDKNGNPTEFHTKWIMGVQWIYSFFPPKIHYDSYLSYDSLNRLIHAKEVKSKEYKYQLNYKEIYFVYDSLGRVVKETILDIEVVPERIFCVWCGIEDSTLSEKLFFYTNQNKVDYLINQHSDGTGSFKSDTSLCNLFFDSLFKTKTTRWYEVLKEEYDNLGNVIFKSSKRNYFDSKGNLLESEVLNQKYYYSAANKLIKTELSKIGTDYTSVTLYDYLDNGLLKSISTDTDKTMFLYSYY